MSDYKTLKKQYLHIIGSGEGEPQRRTPTRQSLAELCRAYKVKASDSVVVDISPFYQTPWGRRLFIEKYKGSIPLVPLNSDESSLPAPIGEGSENLFFPDQEPM